MKNNLPKDLTAEQEVLLEKYSNEYQNILLKTKHRHDESRFQKAIKEFPDITRIKWLDSTKKLFDYQGKNSFIYPNHLNIHNFIWNYEYSLPMNIRKKVNAAFSTKLWSNNFFNTFIRFGAGNFAADSYSYIFRTKFLSDIFGTDNRPNGMADKKLVNAYYNIIRSCSGFFANGNTIWVAKNPTVITIDDRKRFHNEDGPAVEFEDGHKIYAYHGVHIENERIITDPESLDIREIVRERNSEVQRVMIERYGMERYLHASNAKIVDKDERWGTLYKTTTRGEWFEQAEKNYFLLVTNRTAEPDGTYKNYVLPVHPQCRPLPNPSVPNATYGGVQKITALNAVASTFGLRGEEYAKLLEAES